MDRSELKEPSEIRDLLSLKFIDPCLEYWFSNHQHIRSPFPGVIRNELKNRSSVIFFEWIDDLAESELKDMKEDEFVDMFETILFNEALKLVDDEDQQLTIVYPFLPRLEDKVNHTLHGEGTIVRRKEVVSKENKKLFELDVLSNQTGHTWKAQFELPA